MNVAIENHLIFVDGKAVPFRQTPNCGGTLKPEGVVLHDTAGGLEAAGSISWLCNPAAKASAHVVVSRFGVITQLAKLNTRTWHAGKSSWRGRPNVNGFAIGVEIVNPGKLAALANGTYINDLKVAVKPGAANIVREATTSAHGHGWWLDYTAVQIEAVIALCAAIRDAYGISWIGTHWEIAPGRKIDTNAIFPLDAVRGRVFGRASGETKATDKTANNSGIVNVGSLNMRAMPGVAGTLIKTIPRGTKVLIRDVDHVGADKWLLVDAASRSGWVAARYVDFD